MRFEIDSDARHAVGPYTDLYGHGPVTVLTRWADSGDDARGREVEYTLYACLDCGYVSNDSRQFAHEDCDREDNTINTTWREKLPEGTLDE